MNKEKKITCMFLDFFWMFGLFHAAPARVAWNTWYIFKII